MVEIIEHVGDDQLVPQQTGQAVAAEREKKTQNLRILLIDDNIVCLAVMTSQLKHCGFQVTSMREALQALDLLRRNTNAYDIVLTDVVRFDLSGFQLLGIINRQFGIPVIMITAMDDERVMAEGIKYGAIHYLVKPVRLEILQTVCEHAIRVRDYNNNNPVNALLMQTRFYVDGNENLNAKLFLEDDDDYIDDDDDDEKRKKKKKKDARISSSSGESSSPIQKKPRVVWDARLHHKFLEAVLLLDMDKAVPKKILEIMNEPNLTRENVASHLQKFRNVLRKERERFCQEMAKNPMEAMQHFLNPTIPPAPDLTINLHHHHYNNFSSGQEMMMSSSTNFPQQRSLYSAGNNFTHHSQQQLIQNVATTESSSSSSSSFSKTAETIMLMSGVMGYSTIDHRNQKNIFDQDSALQQLLVSPQAAAVPYQDTASSSSSSSSSRGNNIGGGQSARPPTNVHPSQAAVGGDGGHLVPYLPGPTNVQAFQAALGGGADGDVSPYQVMMPTNVQPFQAAGDGGDVAPYQVMPPTNVLQSFQATVGGGGDVGLYQFMSPTNVQPFQNDVGGGGDVAPHQFMLPANVQAFQAAVSGGDGGDVAPYHFMPPINVQPFQASDGGGNSGDGDVASYQVMPPTNVQPFQAGDGGDVVVPYQAMPPTNVQPSQAGGGGGYVADSSSDKGKKVHLSSSINDHVVDNYYYDQVMPTTNQSASDYSIEGNNNDGYLKLPSIISYQASPSQPNTSLEESINNSIVPYQAMHTEQLFQPNTSVEESINNSIVPCQAKPTQQPYQPNDSIGGFIDNSVVPYQAMPTQQPFQPSASIGGSIENSIAAYQAMPSQANTSDEGSIDNFTVPYQARPTQELSQPTDSIGEFIGSSIVPYQAMPTHQLSQPTDSIGEFTDNSTVPYQAMPTHQPSQPTDSIGGFNDNSIVAYDQAWPTQPHTSLEETIDNSIIPYQAWLTQELSQPTGYIGGSIDNSIVPYQSWYAQNISDLSGSIGGNSGENNGQLLPSINSMVLYQDEHTKQPSQEIGTLGGNSGAVGYTQPYITDQSSSFSSLFLSPDENSYFSENNYGYCMQALPADSTNVVQGNNTNAEPVRDTFVGENINGFDHQMMNPSVADDSVPEINNIHENNIDDLPDDEINFMIDQLPNYGTSPSIR